MKKILLLILLFSMACFPALRAVSKPVQLDHVEARITSVVISLGGKGDGDPFIHLEMEVQSPVSEKGLILKRIFATRGAELDSKSGTLEQGDMVSFEVPKGTLSRMNDNTTTTLLKDLAGFTVLKKSTSADTAAHKISPKPNTVPSDEKVKSTSNQVPWEKPASWSGPPAVSNSESTKKQVSGDEKPSVSK